MISSLARNFQLKTAKKLKKKTNQINNFFFDFLPFHVHKAVTLNLNAIKSERKKCPMSEANCNCLTIVPFMIAICNFPASWSVANSTLIISSNFINNKKRQWKKEISFLFLRFAVFLFQCFYYARKLCTRMRFRSFSSRLLLRLNKHFSRTDNMSYMDLALDFRM